MTSSQCMSQLYQCAKLLFDKHGDDGAIVRCEGTTFYRYKRLLATCYAGSINLNAEMVRRGWALAYRRYSEDYVSAEDEAQNAKRGTWAGEFEPPWEWRRK